MYQGAWKTDDKDKDIEEDRKLSVSDDEYQDNHKYSEWDRLPDLILERIFSQLSMREKYWASMTCRNWYRAFHLPETWATFNLDDYTLTRRKFNYYSGWQYILDHYRTMQCLSNIGRHIRYLVIEPMMNFYNLYEFMNMLSYYAEDGGKDNYSVEGVGHLIRGLRFIFPCNMRQRAEAEKIRLYGTGGQILASLKRLMSNLGALTRLELIDLMLEYKDARYLLDEVCYRCCLQLRTLILINTTRENYQLLHPGVFLHLHVLVISPQNIGEDVIQLLGFTALRHLHIKSTVFSPPIQGLQPISPKVWQQCHIDNPRLSVHIECVQEVLWQQKAPVTSIIFNSTKAMIQPDVMLAVVENYSKHLRCFIHRKLARFHRSKSFHDRADSSLLLLCRQCPRLKTLVIRERISTATILLLATTAKQLKTLLVRKNAVIIKTDWPKSHEWSDVFYQWLKFNSRKYETVEKEVSQILGYRWTMLSDKEFLKYNVDPY